MFTNVKATRPISDYVTVFVWFGVKPDQKASALGAGFFESQTTYIVAREEVETFITAMKELHYSPGVNPHNKGSLNNTSPVHQIEVGQFDETGPFWWTTPGLQPAEKSKVKGAKVIQADYRKKVVWRSPALVETLRQERIEDDRAEMEM